MSDQPLYAEVAVRLPVHKNFHYAVPEHLREEIAVGKRVRVPFRSGELVGYCVGFPEEPEVPELKEISEVLDEEPLIDTKLLSLARWMADYYCCSLGDALEAVLPSAVRHQAQGKLITIVELALPEEEAERLVEELRPRQHAKARLIETLLESESELTPYDLADSAGVSISTVKEAERRGYIRYYRREAQNLLDVPAEPTTPPPFTDEQREAFEVIVRRLQERRFQTILIHGVTGSGKTELYLRAVDEVVKGGRQGIVLVPEISLTPQTIARFRSRFARIAVLHSRLTPGERHSQWKKIRRGEVDVVVGARSAIFAPTPDTGIIVVDEEHENTYKQENTPRYSARDLAVVRGEMEEVVVLLGSATPSLESYHNALTGKYDHIRLTERIEKRPMPEVRLVDMTSESRRGYRPISSPLKEAIRTALSRGEQVILFQNRRGFSPYLQCTRCGYTFKCNLCDVALTYHKRKGRLQCHYCHRERDMPEVCPQCHADRLRTLGAGTERIEEVMESYFGGYSIARMDSDTMRTRSSYERVLGDFASGAIRVLVGTQMIAKGLDFPFVTVVGVISADALLNIPDFRSAERTFQLLSQVAGRAGRGERPGEVIIQTFQPEHYSIQLATRHDYDQFARIELHYRRELSYPPYSRIVRVLVESRSPQRAYERIQNIARETRELTRQNRTEVLGPAPAPITRLRGWYRWQVIYKAPSAGAVRRLCPELRGFIRMDSRLRIIIDVDPLNLL